MTSESSSIKSPHTSVIVLNFNGIHCIERCLRSLEAQTYRDFETIVVDNNSTDGSKEILETKWKDRVRLIFLEENTGYCGGNNRGIEQARGSLLLLLNNDVEAHPRMLEILADASDRYPDAGMFAACIYYAYSRSRFDSTGLLIYPDGACRSRGWLEVDVGQYSKEEEVLGPNGAAAAYRRVMLEETGLFDEKYFSYLEDLDLALRAQLMGYSCIYIPEAIAYHLKSHNFGHHSKLKAFYVERNRLWNLIKLFPLLLVIVSPAFSAYRYILQTYAALTDRGVSGGFVRDYSRRDLVSILIKALLAGTKDLPQMLRKRRIIQKKRRISKKGIYRLISRYKLPALELALKD
jgi:hypothetical protein